MCFVSVFLVRADNAWSPSTPPESVSCHMDLRLEKAENRWRTGKRSDAAQRTGTPTNRQQFSENPVAKTSINHKPERSHAGNRTGGRRFNRLRVQGGVTYGYGYGLVLWDGLSWWLTYLRSARRAPGHQASSSPKMSLGGDPFPTSLSPA